jgi:hypothetical protein
MTVLRGMLCKLKIRDPNTIAKLKNSRLGVFNVDTERRVKLVGFYSR